MFRTLFFLGSIAVAFGDDWQDHVDNDLIGGGLDQGAIIGLDGSVRAISSGFQLKAGEAEALVSLFKQPSDAFSRGIILGGTKYLGIKADDGSIYGKKGAAGIVTAKTEQSIIIGVYGESQQPGRSALTGEKLADKIRDNGN